MLTSPTIVKKLSNELAELKEDVHGLKQYIFLPLKDSEGKYKDSFVKKMLSRSIGRGPFYNFNSKESFLKHVRSGK
ncbi:MAG: hypothetical protein AAB642_00195 [Patescibacteria group bacterium]